MGVHISAVGGTVVVKGIGSLSSHCRCDVGLLSPVPSGSVHCHVLLNLAEIKRLLLERVWPGTLLPICSASGYAS